MKVNGCVRMNVTVMQVWCIYNNEILSIVLTVGIYIYQTVRYTFRNTVVNFSLQRNVLGGGLRSCRLTSLLECVPAAAGRCTSCNRARSRGKFPNNGGAGADRPY